MREILFRGKRKDNGKWVQGFLWKKKYNTDKLFISCFPDEDDNEEVFVIYPETVGQYTGLTDKNGKKIFEGDIVKIYLYEPKGLANYEIGCIRFDDTKARFIFCTNEGKYSFDNTNPLEVIGNIYDNPELLKEREG